MNNKSTLYILGESSFLAKHVYIQLKRTLDDNKYRILLLNHKSNFDCLREASYSDAVINFCGMNRATDEQSFEEANHLFLKKVLSHLPSSSSSYSSPSLPPFFMHISSLMVHGFEDDRLTTSPQKWFIRSKLNGEMYLKAHYDSDALCIVRPSNIFGYDCKPYYNNLLSSLVFEKITGATKITSINKHCIRNMLSVGALVVKLLELIQTRTAGIYNILSNNTVSLETIVKMIYSQIPATMAMVDGAKDALNDSETNTNIVLHEHLGDKIKQLEEEMRLFLELQKGVIIRPLAVLSQPRGDMVEISNLHSTRMYKITLTPHSIRGNHFHFAQIEEFHTNRDKVLFLFAFPQNVNVVLQHISSVAVASSSHNMQESIRIQPNIIHTLVNDFHDNCPEIIVCSTQEFIANVVPDTEYISIV